MEQITSIQGKPEAVGPARVTRVPFSNSRATNPAAASPTSNNAWGSGSGSGAVCVDVIDSMNLRLSKVLRAANASSKPTVISDEPSPPIEE